MSLSKLSRHVSHLQSSAIRELLKHSKMEGVISLGGGIPDAALFDHEGIQTAMEQVLASDWNDAFQYGLSEGLPALRESIGELMAGRGVKAGVDDIVITSGSQQSLDILARVLINPGDIVVVERPTYLAALQVFQLAQAQIESVSTDGDGMNIDELETLVKQKAVKAVYLVPTFGNPSGVTLTPARRAQLVALSKQYDFLIIEDEPYSEINFSDTRYKPLLAHAQEQGEGDNIIYTSTFSKILAPGTRVGWVIVPAWLKRAVVTLKQATDLHTSALSQALTEQYLQTGRLPAQIDRIRKAYKQKCDTLSHALNQELGEYLTFHQPKGGMFLWATFKDGRNTTEWLKNTLANGVVFVPGEFFYSDHPDHSTLRMSYVTPSEENLKEAVRRLKISLT
ncbi:PLP-dependent aminotransferase family protein [Cronobacter turicensis]|nr:PLP-dependent aminotransferase family protein [Cronobacter turicensis]